MSIPAIYFAFHVDTALYIWGKLKEAPRIFWLKTEHKPKKKSDDGTYSNQTGSGFVSSTKTATNRALNVV